MLSVPAILGLKKTMNIMNLAHYFAPTYAEPKMTETRQLTSLQIPTNRVYFLLDGGERSTLNVPRRITIGFGVAQHMMLQILTFPKIIGPLMDGAIAMKWIHAPNKRKLAITRTEYLTSTLVIPDFIMATQLMKG